MNASLLDIRRLSSGGMIVNYRCPSRCGHCLYACSPRRESGYIDSETAENVFRGVKKLGCPSVHIGGGEPMLDPSGLADVLRAAARQHVAVDYVETNSAWFVNPSQARDLLRFLVAAGLKSLLVSISPFHNRYIPFYKVKGAVAAARDEGVGVFPWVNGFWDELNRLPDDKTHDWDELENIYGPQYWRGVLSRYWIHPGGRVFQTFREIFRRRPVETYIDTFDGCIELEDVSHFHVDLFQKYIPALCSGITIDFPDIGKPLDPGKYPLISMLYARGPAALYRWAVEERGFKPSEGGYVSKCHLCLDIREYLVLRRETGTVEFGPRGFYSELASRTSPDP